MRHLRHADYKRMPWKNGLGVTEEVISHPPGAGIASFEWRVSIARVGADGPFSVFAGIDRTIALLDGEGLYLDMPGLTVELDRKGEPLPFSGDLEISSRNRNGPTTDLNVMTRRSSFEHRMRRIRGGLIDTAQPGTLIVFNETVMAFCGDQAFDLDRFDALISDPGDSPLRVPPGTDTLVIEVIAIQR